MLRAGEVGGSGDDRRRAPSFVEHSGAGTLAGDLDFRLQIFRLQIFRLMTAKGPSEIFRFQSEI
jgi:hypothetical protein